MTFLIDESQTRKLADEIAQSLGEGIPADVSDALAECEVSIIKNDYRDLANPLCNRVLRHMKGLTIGQALEVVREVRISLADAA